MTAVALVLLAWLVLSAPISLLTGRLMGGPECNTSDTLATAAVEHSPRRWFERGAWPECSCGLAPDDNAVLNAHWAEHGLVWWADTHGQLKYRAVSH